MTWLDGVRFAFQAIRGHGLRTGLSLLGVSIGVCAVVLLTALGEGARRYVTGQFTSLGTNILVVIPGKTETSGAIPGIGKPPNDLTIDDARALARQIPGIDQMSPISMGNETVAHRELKRQIPVLGATHELLEIRQLEVAQGSFLPEGDWEQTPAVAVLGHTVAQELFPDQTPLGQTLRVGDWRFRVAGVLKSRGTHMGVDMDDMVIIPVDIGLRMFNKTSLFRIIMTVHAHSMVETVKDRILTILDDRHGEEDVTCITQDAVIASLTSILQALTMALTGIAAISLSVAGIGIMNVMLVSVSERTGEIGLLMAVGAERRQIMLVFLIEAMLLSTAGGCVGIGGAWGIVKIVEVIYPSFPLTPPLWAVAAALGVSVGVGAIFGVLPARRAVRLDPVAALGKS